MSRLLSLIDRKQFLGELYDDIAMLISYSTDASVYRELPQLVVFPTNESDIVYLTHFATEQGIPIIPRTAGTSLAGQVVGNGIVMDMSKYFNHILEINAKEQYAIIQPGVVRDELNLELKPLGYFFAPETATSNRCRIGGMCGNNSCGANSLRYGSTRHHILSLKAVLSNGEVVDFHDLSQQELTQKINANTFEGSIYQSLIEMLSPQEVQQEIVNQFPNPRINRRSMGYAIDELIDKEPFTKNNKPLNLCNLIVGSEGTLAIITEIKVKLTPLPPSNKALLVVETSSIEEALQGNILALQVKPDAIELVDKTILDLAKLNITQRQNRFFIQGDPAAILIIEFNEENDELILQKIEETTQLLQKSEIGSAFTPIFGDDIAKVWALRKSGLGIMSNVKGDAKPTTVVEDIAIIPELYPQFYQKFKKLLDYYALKCAFYAHISTGELHNKPIFNLKDEKEVEKFRAFAIDVAKVVKELRGSLSGEHGDGRLRGEFLPLMVGEKNYRIFQNIKHLFDPKNILNVGKITDTPSMNTHLRYSNHHLVNQERYKLKTIFDFSDTDGILRAIEKCNGSADCKKSAIFGGTMCPTYQATLDERYSTRCRSNILREFITHSPKKNPFNHKEIYNALDNCLACKACKSECPSNIDMTKLRAEFLYHYYKQHFIPLRTLLIAYYPIINQLAIPFAKIYNYVINQKKLSSIFKRAIGFSPLRSLPNISPYTFRKWCKSNIISLTQPQKTVYLFIDEFTNTQDVTVGKCAVLLLQQLNYQVKIVSHAISGRTFLSKGMLKQSKKIAEKNVQLFSKIINSEVPLLGIEPSAILSFRDEYPELVSSKLREDAVQLAPNCLLIDEFIAKEFALGHINRNQFTSEKKSIIFHSHCYQKALSNTKRSIEMMEIPENFHVTEIKSGCCGMAGAFGYEKEHYDLSLQVAQLTLIPTIEQTPSSTIITATGTSCRHQIKDGTQREAFHPIEILYNSLINPSK